MMSRSFHPPDTLSKEDIRTISEVRRDIWVDGFYGMAVGSATGLILHMALSALGRSVYRKPPLSTLNRNTAMAWTMGGGALGSLILSTTRGKNEVHQLHPIFRRGAREPEPIPSLDENEVGHENQLQAQVQEELLGRERNRLFRRTTLQVRSV